MLAEKIIRKHVAVIHAYSLMSVLQRKVFNVLLYEALKNKSYLNSHGSTAVECQIAFSNLCKAVKFNSNNTQYLKEAIDGLASLKIEWNLLKDKAPSNISFVNLRILHGSPTFYQDNTINFSFHRLMLDLVDNPSIYGTLDIDLQSEFESKYSHALYENSTRFTNLHRNKFIQLPVFRKILGVSDDKYRSMRELTRNVITPSIEEVNDRACFVVNLEAVKNGRKIAGFEVSVASKNKVATVNNSLSNALDDKKIYNELYQTFGTINQSVLDAIIKNYTEEYILEKIAYTKKYAKRDSSNFYPIPYFISALKHNYKSNESRVPQITNEQTTQRPIQTPVWESRLHGLLLDLKHWENFLNYVEARSDETQIKNIKNIISQCEERLKQHYLEKPVEEGNV